MKQHSTETIPQITPKAKPMQADLTEKYDPEEPTEDEVRYQNIQIEKTLRAIPAKNVWGGGRDTADIFLDGWG